MNIRQNEFHPKIKLFKDAGFDDTWEIKWYEGDGLKVSKKLSNGKAIHIWEIRGGYQCAALVDGSYTDHGYKAPEQTALNILQVHKYALDLEKKHS